MQVSNDSTKRTSVTLVLGMHRSGTSLCANVLHALGINMAEDANRSPDNQRGHWERPQINYLNDSVFAAFNRRWNDYAHVLSLPEGWCLSPQVRAIQADIVGWLRPNLLAQPRFGFKDPRTARLLPLWQAVFADMGIDPVYVFCVRDPAQVARSVAARDRMEREQSEYRWLIYNADAIAGVGNARVCIIPYEDWFAAPDLTVRRLAQFVGAPRREDAAYLAGLAADLVDASLRHDDAGPNTIARKLSRRLHRSVLDCVPGQAFSPALLSFCESLSDFEQMVQPMLISTEVLRASVADQNKVIEDLNGLIRRLRRENEALRADIEDPHFRAAAQ
jgi:hypothetical protein